MKKIIILSLWCGLLTACVTAGNVATNSRPYEDNCTKTDNYGTIDAYEVLNIQKKTTFQAVEYINCKDGRNLVVVIWDAAHDKTSANLAGQLIAKFFTHFHANENIEYLLVPEESGENLFVYEFEYYTPHRTIYLF